MQRDLKRLSTLVETDELWLGVDDNEGRADKTEQIFSTLLSYCGEEGTPRKSDVPSGVACCEPTLGLLVWVQNAISVPGGGTRLCSPPNHDINVRFGVLHVAFHTSTIYNVSRRKLNTTHLIKSFCCRKTVFILLIMTRSWRLVGCSGAQSKFGQSH